MRRVVLSPLFVVGCGDDQHHPFNPSIPDAAGVKVTGCDDPTLWTAPALEAATLNVDAKAIPCPGMQYPLHDAQLSWWTTRNIFSAERQRIARACWRVVDAVPGSGWAAGDRFETAPFEGTMTLAGFSRSVTVDGRILRDDGTLAFATTPATEALDAARVLAPDANPIVAVISPEMWVERDAIHWGNERIATEEVIDASGRRGTFTPFTLHRIGGDLVWRSWWYKLNNGALYLDVPLGPGTRARLAPTRRRRTSVCGSRHSKTCSAAGTSRSSPRTRPATSSHATAAPTTAAAGAAASAAAREAASAAADRTGAPRRRTPQAARQAALDRATASVTTSGRSQSVSIRDSSSTPSRSRS